MKIYISGRISGNEENYKKDFNWIEEQLENLNDIVVVNPINLDVEEEEWTDCIVRDIKCLKDCDAILLMSGNFPIHKSSNWKKSYGAKIERLVAKKYGLKIFYGWKDFRKWYLKLHKYDLHYEVK